MVRIQHEEAFLKNPKHVANNFFLIYVPYIFYYFVLWLTCINPTWNILIVNCVTNSRIWNTFVTLQGIDYKLPEDDTIV